MDQRKSGLRPFASPRHLVAENLRASFEGPSVED
jgi:hypothetical protein